jgi:hypothetical protein
MQTVAIASRTIIAPTIRAGAHGGRIVSSPSRRLVL